MLEIEIFEDALDGPIAPAEPVPMAAAIEEIDRVINSFNTIEATLTAEEKTRLENLILGNINDICNRLNSSTQECFQQLRKYVISALQERQTKIDFLDQQLVEKESELEVKEVALDKQSKHLALLAVSIEQTNTLEIANLAITDVKILAGSDPDTLTESFVYYTKLALEIGISVLEPFAADAVKVVEMVEMEEKKKGEETPLLRDMVMKKNLLVGIGVSVASIILVLSLIEIVLSCKKQPWWFNGRFRWRRVSWVPGVYGVLIAIMEIVLYALAFQTHWSLHIALFACVYGFCTFCEKLVKKLTRKDRLYETFSLEELRTRAGGFE